MKKGQIIKTTFRHVGTKTTFEEMLIFILYRISNRIINNTTSRNLKGFSVQQVQCFLRKHNKIVERYDKCFNPPE